MRDGVKELPGQEPGSGQYCQSPDDDVDGPEAPIARRTHRPKLGPGNARVKPVSRFFLVLLAWLDAVP